MSQAVAQEFEGLVVLFIFDHALNFFPCAIHYPYTDSLRLHLSLASLAVTQSLDGPSLLTSGKLSIHFCLSVANTPFHRFLSHVFPLDP